MHRILVVVLFALFITACNAVDDMKGMFEKQSLAQEYVKKHYGWNSQLGFNISNGVLVQVTLILNASDVRDETVSELEKIVNEVTSKIFKSEPEAIFIQIIADGER